MLTLVILLVVTFPWGRAASSPSQPASQTSEFNKVSAQAIEAHENDRPAEAIALYQKALEMQPSWERGWWNLGTLFYALDRYLEARPAFRELTLLKPDSGPGWALMGLSEFQLRDYERALADLQKARTLGLGESELLVSVTRYNTAILLTRFTRFEEAYFVLQEFAREGNDNPSVVEALGLSILRMPYLPGELPPERYDLVRTAGQAAYAMASNDPARAEEVFSQLLSRHASEPNVHYAYGLFLAQQDPDRALEEFRRELEISARHVPARLEMARELVKRQDYQAALPLATEAVELAPKLIGAWNTLGRVLLELGEVEGAIERLERGASLQAEDPEVHFLLARAYARAGREEEAARERAEFLRLDKVRRTQTQGPQAIGGLNPDSNRP